MDVMMHSIKAGPDGCADAGETIRVSQEEGERLIKQKFATKATPRFPAREIAMIDPDVAEQKEREEAARRQKEAATKTPQSVQAALAQLDPAEDEDWTSDGKPAMDRIKALTGSATITRDELNAMFPDFRRLEASTASEQSAHPAASPAATNSGPRSNKP